jgi:hypothetical protein
VLSFGYDGCDRFATDGFRVDFDPDATHPDRDGGLFTV